MQAFRRLQSVLSLLLALLWFVPGGLLLFFVIQPLAWLLPARSLRLASWYVRMMSTMFLRCLRMGGARFDVRGRLDTSAPCLVVANHQSLLDICVIFVMCRPVVAGFIARRRYARVPVVGTAIRLAECPVIDPRRDARGAVAVIGEAARTTRHGLVIFPEGHRTRDGQMLPWRTAGLLALLGARRLPVSLVVTDGLWRTPRLVDFAFHIHELRGESEVLGPFTPPEDPDELPAFVDRLRDAMAAHLADMRRRRGALAA